jgi:AcrR family transcriptional regulator
MARKRVEDPDVRRRQIITGAQTALSKKRYHTLVMEDVARAAGISKGLLYLYFKDKEQLFAALARDYLDQIHVRLRELKPTGSAIEDLGAAVAELLDFSENHHEFSTQFVGEQLVTGRHASAIMAAYYDFLSDFATRIRACVDNGSMRPHEVELSADMLIEIIQLYTRRKFLLKKIAKPLAKCAPDVMAVFLNGFGRKGARRGS